MVELSGHLKNKMFGFLLKVPPGPRTNSCEFLPVTEKSHYCHPAKFLSTDLDKKFELSQKFMRDLIWAFENKMFGFLLKVPPGPPHKFL